MNENQSSENQLIRLLSGFPELDEVKVQMLASMIPIITAKKGTVLLKEGEIQKECYFVLEGLVRQYQFVDGTERSTEFYTEKNGSVSSEHYTDQTPSTFYLECEEDCLLIEGHLHIDTYHFEQFPELLEITKRMMEVDLNKIKKTLSSFILLSPKDRYIELIKSRPDLFNRVPLHQIASYLGLTAESLSRIRKRIILQKL